MKDLIKTKKKMQIGIEKTEKELIEALSSYNHTIIEDEETETEIVVEMSIDDIDDLAKETGHGVYYKCRITKYGSTSVEDLFYNWLTEDWEHHESYHADIHQMSDEEIEEHNKDLQIEEKASEHPRYSEYQEYCSDWQSNFNSQYAYHNGNGRETRKIMGNEPLSFAEFLKIN